MFYNSNFLVTFLAVFKFIQSFNNFVNLCSRISLFGKNSRQERMSGYKFKNGNVNYSIHNICINKILSRKILVINYTMYQ